MSKTAFSALITALLITALVWLTAYLALPFWIALLGSALFFAAPQSNLLGLVATLFTALIGVLFGMIYLHLSPIIPNFPYKNEVIIGIIVFVLYLIAQVQYLRYFACTLITLALIVLQHGNWMILCQTIVVGILFGFVAKMVSVAITGRKLE